MNGLLQGIRYAVRQLRKSPGFATAAILSLAVGIGANTAIFGWMRSLVLNPFPGATQPSRIVAIENTAPDGRPLSTSYLDFRDYRDSLHLVDSVTAYRGYAFSVGEAPRTERVWGEVASADVFNMLGIIPEAGRFFSREENDDAQNAHPVVVISHGFWVSHYRSAPSAIGSVLRINQTSFTIIGVAPEDFHGIQAGLGYEFWVPLTMYGQLTHTGVWMLNDRNTRNFMLLARLASGATIEQARSELQTLAGRMAKANADSDQGIGATVLPVWQSHFGAQSTLLTPIATLMAVGWLVLFIVCANLANLLLVRMTGRSKEFGVRLALGATATRLTSQLLIETLVIAFSGSLFALLLAKLLGGALRWLLPAVASPTLLAPPFDGQVFAFTAALAILTTVLAGLIPALRASRADLNEQLNQGGRSGFSGVHGHRLRRLIVISEMTLAFVALVGAALFLKSFQSARALDPGFSPNGVALTAFDFSTANYNAQQTDNFCRRLTERLEQQPGVTAVSYDDTPPLGLYRGNWENLEVEGYAPAPNENMKLYRDLVSPGFFDAMKIPLMDGRDFNWHDDASAPRVMVVNQEFVRHYFANRSVIGRKVRGWGQWFTIIGVVKDSKYHSITDSPQPYFYISIRQIFRPEYGLTFEVRTSGSVNEAISAVRREAAGIDPTLTIFDAEPMTEYVSTSLFGAKISASLLSALSAIGLLMAAMGLYGVMAYSVAQRTREFGVRVALGAHRRDILALILSESVKLTLLGIVPGALLAAVCARVVASQLYGISALDPIIFIGVSFSVGIVGFAASYIPARRAAKIDPMVALRYE